MSTDAFFSHDESPFAVPAGPSAEALDALKYRVHDRLVQQLDLAEVRRLPDHTRRGELRILAARFLAAEDAALAPEAREAMLGEILDELVGLGPLDRLLREPGGGDILVNGPDDVWIEKGGQLVPSP